MEHQALLEHLAQTQRRIDDVERHISRLREIASSSEDGDSSPHDHALDAPRAQ